jgi:UDP-GlcNAc:undecaprenyl-phosphate GlcNAc-1-phosphate transferase
MRDTPMLFACAVAALTSMIAIALLRKLAGPLGLLDRPNHRKKHVGEVPLIGGVAVFIGVVAGAWWQGGISTFSETLLCTAAVLVMLGTLDDRRGLSVRSRLLTQTLMVLAMIAITGVYVRTLGNIAGVELRLGWLGVPFTVVAVIGLLNAFNLMDGIDGLAGGLALVSICAILLFRGGPITPGVPMVLMLLAAAALPYLAANLGLFGGKIFLGDAGSMLLGYLLAWAMIGSSQRAATELVPTDVLWCVAVPVLDTLAVMVRRMRQRRSPFRPDRAHIHHLLLDAGLGSRTTLLVLLVVAAALAGVGGIMHRFGAAASLVVFAIVLLVHVVATVRLREGRATRAEQAPQQGSL